MKKQTAVEWLEIQLKKGIDYNPLDLSGYAKAVDKVFAQAKTMEKGQIIDAHLTGLIYPLEIEATKQAEQYYNETYGN